MVDLENKCTVMYAAPAQSYDLLSELQSAASLIMDKAECESLLRELAVAQGPARVAA